MLLYWLECCSQVRGSSSLPPLMWIYDALPSPPSAQPTSFLLSSTPWIMKPSKHTVELRVPQAGDRDVMNWLQLCPDLQTVCQKAWVMSGVMWRGSNARNLTVHCPPGVYHSREVDRWRGACHEKPCSAAKEPLQQVPHNWESNLLFKLWFVIIPGREINIMLMNSFAAHQVENANSHLIFEASKWITPHSAAPC